MGVSGNNIRAAFIRFLKEEGIYLLYCKRVGCTKCRLANILKCVPAISYISALFLWDSDDVVDWPRINRKWRCVLFKLKSCKENPFCYV